MVVESVRKQSCRSYWILYWIKLGAVDRTNLNLDGCESKITVSEISTFLFRQSAESILGMEAGMVGGAGVDYCGVGASPG